MPPKQSLAQAIAAYRAAVLAFRNSLDGEQKKLYTAWAISSLEAPTCDHCQHGYLYVDHAHRAIPVFLESLNQQQLEARCALDDQFEALLDRLSGSECCVGSCLESFPSRGTDADTFCRRRGRRARAAAGLHGAPYPRRERDASRRQQRGQQLERWRRCSLD
jgi:hypothetical protein